MSQFFRRSSLTLFLWFAVSIWTVGVITEVCGFTQHVFTFLWLILIASIVLLIWLGLKLFLRIKYFSNPEKLLLVGLVAMWLVHFIGVLVPETGFDAVWYHLPVADAFMRHGGFFYWPKYYQSLNPFFSDGVFLLGYQAARESGAKLVAYLFGLGLILSTYLLARQFLNRFWSLLLVLTVSSFQVVTWQSSSFYIDVAKAFWEVCAVYFLVRDQQLKKQNVFWAGLFFGASLGTKLFSILLWPVFAVMLFIRDSRLFVRNFLIFTLSSLVVSLPFYLFAYLHTGNPFYSIGIHVDKLGQIGGNASLFGYIWQRTLLLPSSLTQLTLFSKDYTTLLFLVFCALPFFFWKQIWQHQKLRLLLLFSAGQWLVWWYVPPLSTRYALSGFIALAIILFWCLAEYLKEKSAAKNYVLLTVGLAIVLNLLPRTLVLKRNFEYILGFKSRTQYLQQFYDGNIDTPLKEWNHLK